MARLNPLIGFLVGQLKVQDFNDKEKGPFGPFLHSQDCTIGQIPWKVRRSELDMDLYYKLKYYKDWLIEKNIPIKEIYINMLN